MNRNRKRKRKRKRSLVKGENSMKPSTPVIMETRVAMVSERLASRKVIEVVKS